MRPSIRILLSIALASVACFAGAPPSRGSVAADLPGLSADLERLHPDPWTRVTREQFDAAAAALAAELPALSDRQAAVRLGRLLAMVGDPHTSIDVRPLQGPVRAYPFWCDLRDDGMVIVAADAAHGDLVGAEVLAVGGVSTTEAVDRLGTLFAWENEAWKRHRIPQFLASPDALEAVGLAPASGTTTFAVRSAEGTERTVELECLAGRPSLEVPDRMLVGAAAVSGKRPPSWYWYAEIPGSKALYVRYDRCSNQSGKSVAAFASDVLGRLDQGDLDRVIIDLRFNGGGNSALLAPLVNGLAQRSQWAAPGATMVLIGNGTFSSAQLNAVELKRRANATLVGHPTGQRPNAYGEIRQYALPNSGLKLGHSTRRFVTDPEDRPSTMPDVPVAVTIADWREGRDPELTAAVDWRPSDAAE